VLLQPLEQVWLPAQRWLLLLLAERKQLELALLG